jgi:hypothetical protein
MVVGHTGRDADGEMVTEEAGLREAGDFRRAGRAREDRGRARYMRWTDFM